MTTRIRRWKFLGPPSGPGGPLDGETQERDHVSPGYAWPVIGPDGEIGWTDRIHTYKLDRVRRSDGTAIFRYAGLSLVEEQK